ncbi:acyloxyacyl hydrolase [Photobacterium sp. SDRW27]|uniref:acyloxyacyl hydrolase n=1 Tax=Photobacterium obscurum TaxID=2829490 RepID=UPI002243781E|nr:acyloxyacyl hydrolase [Photobacterium obscurum]MCW8328963.1 acyloxyacyl hydrolase [Photobacterium obscurum]
MVNKYRSLRTLLALVVSIVSTSSYAVELAISAGIAPQPDESYNNSLLALDAILFDWQRSSVQTLSLGTSVTYLKADTTANPDDLIALSVFPELKLFAERFDRRWFFQVRALGPTWISEKHLGKREQAMHFAFLAQVGGGMYLGASNRGYINVYYRHFSNANLKKPNDGFDVPFNLSFGYRF